MAHEIETNFYAGEVPWHGLGVYVGDKPVTSKEAIVAAGLDWKANLKDMYILSDDPKVTPIVNGQSIDTHKAVVRTSDNHVLGVVGNRYRPVQNEDAFQFMDSLVDNGSMRYHTAGSLRNGQRVWLLGQTGSFDVVPGDQVDKFLFFWNSHDGSTALRCLFTTVRVVCANTARLALEGRDRDGIRLCHTKNINTSLVKAKEILGFANDKFNSFENEAKYLTEKQINTKELEDFTKKLFPDPPKGIKSYSITKARDEVTRLFSDGRGNGMPKVKGTAWAAFNAVTEYANYYRVSRGTNKQERRFEYTMFGSGTNLIDKAQTILLAA